MSCLVAFLFPPGRCWQPRPQLLCFLSPYKEEAEKNLEGTDLCRGRMRTSGIAEHSAGQ